MLRTLATAAIAALFATAALGADVLAARTLRVGTVVGQGDLSVGAGAEERAAALVGLEVRRAIYAGWPITGNVLGPPTLVRRNQIVVMVYRAGALGLRAEGRAMGAGGAGEIVEVMNLTSRQTVRATVMAAGRVEVHR